MPPQQVGWWMLLLEPSAPLNLLVLVNISIIILHQNIIAHHLERWKTIPTILFNFSKRDSLRRLQSMLLVAAAFARLCVAPERSVINSMDLAAGSSALGNCHCKRTRSFTNKANVEADILGCLVNNLFWSAIVAILNSVLASQPRHS
jgi:hypothetical protein